jgi:hypothetical protein
MQKIKKVNTFIFFNVCYFWVIRKRLYPKMRSKPNWNGENRIIKITGTAENLTGLLKSLTLSVIKKPVKKNV